MRHTHESESHFSQKPPINNDNGSKDICKCVCVCVDIHITSSLFFVGDELVSLASSEQKKV